MSQLLTFEEIKNNHEIQTYLNHADYAFASMGYKEHGFAHALYSANVAEQILKELGHEKRKQELAKIAAYLHDIGSFVGQRDHSQSSAVIFLNIIDESRYDNDVFDIVSAIGCHEDKASTPISEIAAAVVIGDKMDMRNERVRTRDPFYLDRHGRVVLACKNIEVIVNKTKKTVELYLDMDTTICSVMEYFEVFMARTIYCKNASNVLNCSFELYINKDKFL